MDDCVDMCGVCVYMCVCVRCKRGKNKSQQMERNTIAWINSGWMKVQKDNQRRNDKKEMKKYSIMEKRMDEWMDGWVNRWIDD